MGGFKNSLLPHFLQFCWQVVQGIVKPENLCYIQGIPNIQVYSYNIFQINLQSLFEDFKTSICRP